MVLLQDKVLIYLLIKVIVYICFEEVSWVYFCLLFDVNGMPNVVSSDLYMFADDTKLYHTITSQSDCNILQLDLNNVINWGNTWLTNFNLTNVKFCLLAFKSI